MSLDLWLSRGKKVQIGGRDLIMMPLPLSKLKQIGHWLEDNCDDLVREVRVEIRAGAAAPNPLTMVTRILLKVDVVETVFEIFSLPKDPVTREPINKDLSREFFEEYLDIPASHAVYNAFVESVGEATKKLAEPSDSKGSDDGWDVHFWDSLFEHFASEYGFSPEDVGRLTYPQINRYIGAAYFKRTGSWEFEEPVGGNGTPSQSGGEKTVPPVKKEEPVVEFEPALSRVRNALSPKSVVPASPDTNRYGYSGPPKEYSPGVLQMGFRVNNNPEDWKAIEERFKNIKDHSGRSMAEVCKEYWEKKKKRGSS